MTCVMATASSRYSYLSPEMHEKWTGKALDASAPKGLRDIRKPISPPLAPLPTVLTARSI